jgi:hypothetical protein
MIDLDVVRGVYRAYKEQHKHSDLFCCKAHDAADLVPKLVQTIEDLLERISDNPVHPDEHEYLSTACLHGEHRLCRQLCKFCGAECTCKECEHPLSGHVQMLLQAMGERRVA